MMADQTCVPTGQSVRLPGSELNRSAGERPIPLAERLEILDGLRGVAASAVFLMHAGIKVSPEFRSLMASHVDLGTFGVMLFFLCSGFVIPLSLGRHRSVRRFWVRRFFRLYPLYWFSALCALACYEGGLVTAKNTLAAGPIRESLVHQPLGTVLANLTMLQPLLGYPNLIDPYWTLAIELVFYATLSILFAAGSLTRIVPITIRFLLGAIAIQFLAHSFHLGLMTGNICAFCTMFVGVVYQRVYTGELRPRVGLGVTALALIMVVTSTLNDMVVTASSEFSWNVLAARIYAFALFGVIFFQTPVRVPIGFSYLGRISYSIYLIHPLVLVVVPPWPNPALTMLVWSLAVLVFASATYRWIEEPCIGLGRLSRRGVGVKAVAGDITG